MPEPSLRLTVHTPGEVVLDRDVRGMTAEDPSGRFGVRPGGEPVVAALLPGVLTYRDDEGVEHFVAVGPGMLDSRPDRVVVCVRSAVTGSSPGELRDAVLDASQTHRSGEEAMRDAFRHLYQKLVVTLAEEERG